MRRKGCLWGFVGVAGILLLCCVLGIFVGLPRFQDAIGDDLADELSTQVASQIESQLPAGASLEPGEYRLSMSELEQQVAAQTNQETIDSFNIGSEGDEIVLSVKTNGQTIEFRGVPVVNDLGELEMTDMSSNGGALNYILPADKIGQVVESSVNNYLGAQGMLLQDVRLDGDDLVFEVID